MNEYLPVILEPATTVASVLINNLFPKTNFKKQKANNLNETVLQLLKSGEISNVEYWKTKNYLQIAELADRALSRKKQGNIPDKVDLDWHFRFYEAASGSSDEDMQVLWAKLLAGEIDSPGSYSLRTINVLKFMTKKEALLFKKACSYSFKGRNISCKYIVPTFSDCNLPFADEKLMVDVLTEEEIDLLSEIGLVKKASDNVRLLGESETIGYLEAKGVLIKMDNNGWNPGWIELLPFFTFTKIGEEIASIIDIQASMDICVLVAVIMNSRNIINKYSVIKNADETLNSDNELPIIEYPPYLKSAIKEIMQIDQNITDEMILGLQKQWIAARENYYREYAPYLCSNND